MKKWRLRHLLFSWFSYWIAIGALKLGPAIGAIWRATRGTSNGTSSVGVSWTDAAGLTVEVIDRGTPIWAGSATISSLITWIAVPPLILWVAWLALSARERSREQATDLLGEGSPPDFPVGERTPSQVDRA